MYYNTVNKLLIDTLITLMNSPVFESFRLVGGTALSLQIGHRVSVDIDLFTDAPYGTIDFKIIDEYLEETFLYSDHFSNLIPAIGKSYRIGANNENVIKLDVFYTDAFIQPCVVIDNLRMASLDDIVAMKIDVVQRGGREKGLLGFA